MEINYSIETQNIHLLRTTLILLILVAILSVSLLFFLMPLALKGKCADYSSAEAQMSLILFNNQSLDHNHNGIACDK